MKKSLSKVGYFGKLKEFRVLHRGAHFQFLFRWIYYSHNIKSIRKETGKTYHCTVYCPDAKSCPETKRLIEFLQYLGCITLPSAGTGSMVVVVVVIPLSCTNQAWKAFFPKKKAQIVKKRHFVTTATMSSKSDQLIYVVCTFSKP